MPDITDQLNAAAAFTKATGIEVEHGWAEAQGVRTGWGFRETGVTANGIHVATWRGADDADDRDLAVWRDAMVRAITTASATGVTIEGPTEDSPEWIVSLVYYRGENLTEITGTGPNLTAALTDAAKKIGGE